MMTTYSKLRKNVNFTTFRSILEQKLSPQDIRKYALKCHGKQFHTFEEFIIYYVNLIEDDRTKRIVKGNLFDGMNSSKQTIKGKNGMSSLRKLELSVSTLKSYLEDEDGWRSKDDLKDKFNRDRFYKSVLKDLELVRQEYYK